MLDEQALRKPDFRGGVPIRLSDGQEWSFPEPTLDALYPTKGPDGKTVVVQGYDFGPEYDRLLNAYVSADDSDALAELAALSDIAFYLLSLNYVLTFDDLGQILRMRKATEDGTGNEHWRAIGAVAFGQSPKPTPVGETPASAPTGSPAP